MTLLSLVLAAALPAQAAEPRDIALDEAYRMALKRSEELAIRGEGVAEHRARVWPPAHIRLHSELTGSPPPAYKHLQPPA